MLSGEWKGPEHMPSACISSRGEARVTSRRHRKNPAAVALGKLGARIRQQTLTPEERRASAQHAARVRWAKHRKNL